ncbi:MAG: hypothetical protein FWF03_07065 [Defluviitaleaceae bacterium]|nr:hypothetical protein [Defluviitaleaceae bacterium]
MPSPTEIIAPPPEAGWAWYINEERGFAAQYPAKMHFVEITREASYSIDPCGESHMEDAAGVVVNLIPEDFDANVVFFRCVDYSGGFIPYILIGAGKSGGMYPEDFLEDGALEGLGAFLDSSNAYLYDSFERTADVHGVWLGDNHFTIYEFNYEKDGMGFAQRQAFAVVGENLIVAAHIFMGDYEPEDEDVFIRLLSSLS